MQKGKKEERCWGKFDLELCDCFLLGLGRCWRRLEEVESIGRRWLKMGGNEMRGKKDLVIVDRKKKGELI
jgi:hypothetical protein